jgi:hypothetical protein
MVTDPSPGMRSRPILPGICKAFTNNNRTQTHYEPYESFWVPPGAPKSEAQRVMDEIYTSRAMNEAHKDIQRLEIDDKNCKLPRSVGALMFGSDGLQLGAFSTKKAWVLYMWLGNVSKYERCKPSSNTCYELAHIPSVSVSSVSITTPDIHIR